jgi:integrase
MRKLPDGSRQVSVHPRKGVKGTSYRVLWRNSADVQRSATFRLKRDADLFDAARKLDPDELDAQPERVADPAPKGGKTVADVWRILAESRDVGASREATDDSLFRIQLAPLHRVPVAALDALAIRRWMKNARAELRPNGRRRWADSTVGDALGTLRKILTAAVELGLIQVSPAATVDAPDDIRPPLTEDDVLTPAEVAAVLAAAPRRWRALFAVMAYSGGRLSEILALTPATVDLCAGTITLGVQKVQDVGGRVTLKLGGKTRKASRTIALPAPAVDALREHMAAYPVEATTSATDYGTNPLVIFRTESGAIPGRSSLRQRVWNPTRKAAGIDRPTVTMQHLRHSHASWVYAAGTDPVAAAHRLGHAKPSMGLDTYARFIPKGAAELDRLNAYLADTASDVDDDSPKD